MNRSLQKLLTYSQTGTHISTRHIGYWAQAVSPAVDNACILYCGSEYGNDQQHKLRRVKNEKDDFRFLPVDEHQATCLHINAIHYFQQHQDSIYFFETFNDTVCQ